MPTLSFEFFPPRTPSASALLESNLEHLLALQPAFATVSYGAGGSTQSGTLELVRRLRDTHQVDCGPHLSCVGMGPNSLARHMRDYIELGVRRVVALRGDRPPGYVTAPDEYQSSWELVAALKDITDFEIAVGCYPEGHPDDQGGEDRFTYLQKKADAGADTAISQMFFETRHFLDFRDACAKRGLALPVLPGIMPIHDPGQVLGFAAKCGTVITRALRARFEDRTPEERFAAARDLVVEQVQTLAREGVDHMHIYTLDRHQLAGEICQALS